MKKSLILLSLLFLFVEKSFSANTGQYRSQLDGEIIRSNNERQVTDKHKYLEEFLSVRNTVYINQRSVKQKSQQAQSQQGKNRQVNRQNENRQGGKKQIKSAPKQEDEYKIAREGVGIEGIIVGKSTMDDVIEKLGKNYRWIVHKKYSYQMAYPNGLSFYICQSDRKKQVFDIEIKAPYKAKTSRGIILGKSTVEDVYKIYGRSTSGLEYKGVHFYYTNRDGKKIITTIDIVEPKGLRQCDRIK